MAPTTYDAVVIGGGIAGLTVTWRLLAAGANAICLEADSSPGGCVRTDRIGGYICERGAQNVLEEPNGPVSRLAKDLGISEEIQPPAQKENLLASNGRLFKMPAQLHKLLSTRGILRVARGLVSRSEPEGSEEAIGAWVRRRFGDEFARRVADPMVSGIYAGDPERLSLDATFAAIRDLERAHSRLLVAAFLSKPARRLVYTFRNGMGTLTESLARRIGPALRTRVDVAGISARANGRYRIEGCDGIEARTVIFATAATIAGDIVKRLDPALARSLRSIRNAPVLSAGIGFSTTDLSGPAPKGYGLVRPHCEGARLLGCLFCSSAFEHFSPAGTVLLRIIAGGERDPEAARLGDEELADLVISELGPTLGIRTGAKPVFFRATRYTHGLPQYELGHLKRVREIEQASARFSGIHFAGNSYRGLSVSKVVEQAEDLSNRILQLRAAA
jgi:protoporphyrinogen/coproporphyrinogen III oxidase